MQGSSDSVVLRCCCGVFFKVRQFILRKLSDIDACVRHIATLRLEKPIQVKVQEYQSKRSLSQNNLMWAWYTEISKFWYESTDDWFDPELWHDQLKEKCLGFEVIATPNGQKKRLRSTKKLGVKGMAEYLNNVELYMGSKFQVQLSKPEDLYYESMGVKK